MSDEGIKQLIKEMQSLRASVNKIEVLAEGIEGLKTIFSEFSCKVEETNRAIKSEIAGLALSCSTVNKDLRKTQSKIDFLEKELKNMNLIIYNFDPKHRGPSLASDILSCLNEIVPNLDLERRDIKDIFRLRSKNNGVPPVVIKFISKPLRDLVLRSSGLFSRHKLNISPDYTERERMARDKLKPLLAEARSKNMPAKLRGVRLILQDKILTYDFEDEKIIEVSGPSVRDMVPIALGKLQGQSRQSLDHETPTRSRAESTGSLQGYFSANENELDDPNTDIRTTTTFITPKNTVALKMPGRPEPRAKRDHARIISPSDDQNQPIRKSRLVGVLNQEAPIDGSGLEVRASDGESVSREQPSQGSIVTAGDE